MSQLLCLPLSVLIDMTSLWISVVDLCKLDSAFCTRSHREIFLNVMKRTAVDLNTPISLQKMRFVSSKLICWTQLREIGICAVYVSQQLLDDEQTCRELWTRGGRSFRVITFAPIVPKAILYEISVNCVGLQELSMNLQPLDGMFVFLLSCCPLLVLHLHSCSELDETIFKAICNQCPTLTELYVEYCTIPDIQHDFQGQNASLVKFVARDNSIINMKTFAKVMTCFPNTMMLHLYAIQSDLFFIDIIKLSSKAVDVDIVFTYCLTDEEVMAITEVWINVQSLKLRVSPQSEDVKGVLSEQQLVSVMRACSQLQILHVDCVITGQSAIATSAGPDTTIMQPLCPHLVELALKFSDTSNGVHTENLSADSILNMLTHCALKRLDIGGPAHVSEAAILTLAQRYGTTLESVSLINCPSVTSAVVLILLDTCPALKDITYCLKGCSSHTEPFIRNIVGKYYPRIRNVEIKF